MALIKEIKLGQAQIEFHIDNKPTEEQLKNRLIKIYDTVNKISTAAEKRGVDTSKWFYTSKQIKSMKETKSQLFI